MNTVRKILLSLAFFVTLFSVSFAQNSKTDDEGVVINGVKWATRNVDEFGTFADTPESAGMFYQWNRKTAWTATGQEVKGWKNSTQKGDTWERANDPSPEGWRVPTQEEFDKLLEEDKVSSEWTTQNDVNGRLFTDLQTGATLFLPAPGYRNGHKGVLYSDTVGKNGSYWSSTQRSGDTAYFLSCMSISASTWVDTTRSNGFSIRPVAE